MHLAPPAFVLPLALVTLFAGCTTDGPPAGPGPRGDAGAGVDAGATSTCASDLTDCSGTCVDTASSFEHCGACGHRCVEGEVCAQSVCSSAGCPDGTTACGGSCLRLDTDPAHCGSCDRACAPAETCQAGECVGCGTGISFAAHVQPIFDASCLGSACHVGARPAGELTLESGHAYADLVGIASSCADDRLLVAAGDPDASYLVQKITGVDICQGNRMPLGGRSLSSAEIDTIRRWVCGGARND